MDSHDEEYGKRLPLGVVQSSVEIGATRLTEVGDVHSFVGELAAWVASSLPAIERGIYKVGADPTELINSFSPWLLEALEKIGPHRTALNPVEFRALMVILWRVYDAIERVYFGSEQSPAIGLSLLPGFDDLLIVLALRSRAGDCSPTHNGNVQESV